MSDKSKAEIQRQLLELEKLQFVTNCNLQLADIYSGKRSNFVLGQDGRWYGRCIAMRIE